MDVKEPETELLTDPKQRNGDLRLVGRAISQGWAIPEKMLQVLPSEVIRLALGVDKDGKFVKVGPRERLRACEVLIKMIGQNAGQGKAGITARADTVNVQQNFGAVGTEEETGCPWIVSHQDQVAAFFGKSPETIKDWRAKGMPGEAGNAGKPGRYDLAEILAWRDVNVIPSGRNEAGDASRTEADRRRANAEAEMKELKAAVMRGDLIERDDVIRQYTHHATHSRALLEQFPD